MGNLLYSYRSFNSDDLRYKAPFNLYQINRFDKVELDKINNDQKISLMTKGMEDNKEREPFVFKDLVISELCDNTSNQIRLWVYSQDSLGNMRIEVYTKIADRDKLVVDYRFLVKSEHIYQLFANLNRVQDLSVYDSHIVPMYLIDGFKYVRYSDYIFENHITPKFRDLILQFLLSALGRIIAFNSLCCVKDDETIEKTKCDNVIVNVNYFIADSDKYQYIKLGNKKSVGTKSKNGLRQVDRNICKRKYQVRGHWHKYWVGKRGEQHLEVKWIEPYYRNKDEQYSLIRHYCFSGE